MRLLPVEGASPRHLTYCTNVHPGESLAEVRAALSQHVVAVKARVSPDAPFGVGLRLSQRAATELDRHGALAELRALLDEHGLYVFTLNGFPMGDFHGRSVKEAVYTPDWLDEARLAYSDRIARHLAALLPDEPGLHGTISTVPGAFRARVLRDGDEARIADQLLRHAESLAHLRDDTGRTIALALEPEPACLLETVGEAVAFFERRLLSPAMLDRFARLVGGTRAAAQETLLRHLGVCLDACHLAVEFERPADAIGALRSAGVALLKTQLSAGLSVAVGGHDAALEAQLRTFAEDVYLHQVVERRGSELRRFVDLPEALATLAGDDTPREWRVHFHVPVDGAALGRLASTQAELVSLLPLVLRAGCAHLEVETYSFGVLPPAHRARSVDQAIADELAWVLARLRHEPAA